MFFAISSVSAFVLYLTILPFFNSATNDAIVVAGTLAGSVFDLPIVVALVSARFMRNTPLAMLVTFISVVIIAEATGASQIYKQYTPLSQMFVCLLASRIYCFASRRNMSSVISDFSALYKYLKIEQRDWQWTNRANSLIDKLTRKLDIITFFIIGIYAVAVPLSGFSLLANLPVIVIGYTIIWLIFFMILVSPILIMERAAKLIVSIRENFDGEEAKTKIADKASVIQKSYSAKKEETKSWIKSGFEGEK